MAGGTPGTGPPRHTSLYLPCTFPVPSQVGHLGLDLRAILPARDGLILVRAAATYPEEALSDPSPPARSTSDLGEVDF